MPASDHFDTYQPVRLVRPQPPKIAPHRPRSSRQRAIARLFLVATVIVFGVVLFSVENAAKLLTNLTATMVVPSIPQLTGASRSPSDSGESSITKSERIDSENRVSTLAEPARASVEAATSENVLIQFEAWAAKRDAQRAVTEQLDQGSSSKTIPERAIEVATGSIGPAQKDRVSRSNRKVRTTVPAQEPPNEIRQMQSARVQAAPPQRNSTSEYRYP
jgi:hypothetical protein